MRKILGLAALSLTVLLASNLIFMHFPGIHIGKAHPEIPSYWYNLINALYYPLIVIALPWLALFPIIIYVLEKFPFRTNRVVSFLALHFAVCFSFSLLQIVVHMFLEEDRGWYYGDVLYRLAGGELFYFGYNVIFYIGVVMTFFAFSFFRQLRQKEINEARLASTLADARLSSLKMKLQPHFIFNALQSVNVLVLDRQPEAASEMLNRLGTLLRRSIDLDDKQLVTVEEELETVQLYLSIEKIRFENRLSVEQSVESTAIKAIVPGLILQPLIENAVKHGIACRMNPGKIHIDIRRKGDLLFIAVSNDGPPLPEKWNLAEHAGFGLKTTAKRLELLYGGALSLSVRNALGGEGVVTELSIPYAEEVFKVAGV